jgi:hypothetical protein
MIPALDTLNRPDCLAEGEELGSNLLRLEPPNGLAFNSGLSSLGFQKAAFDSETANLCG